MKKLILIIIVLFISVLIPEITKAQSTLQFNRVLLVTSSETVPAGTVWKIENVLPSTRLTSAAALTSLSQSVETETSATQQIIKVNNNDVYVASSNAKAQGIKYSASNSSAGSAASASATAYGILNSPIWLP